jgi:hypothetical protein
VSDRVPHNRLKRPAENLAPFSPPATIARPQSCRLKSTKFWVTAMILTVSQFHSLIALPHPLPHTLEVSYLL